MKKIILTLATIATFAFISCATVKEVPEDYSAAQIIQMGQNAYDDKNYKTAEMCYQTAIDRYGQSSEVLLEAKYELAHVYLIQHKYDKAYPIYIEILEMYDYAGYGDLPSAYKKLAQIGISKIPENKRINPLVEE